MPALPLLRLCTGLLIAACFVPASVALGQAKKLPAVERVKYGPHHRHNFIIWHSKQGNGPRPVLVHFFGGAFLFGGPNGGPFLGDMLRNGVTVVGGGYRFRQDGVSKREIMEDGARVIQYLRLHADRFNIDPEKIGVSGYSSGGVIASWVALHNDLRRPASPDPVLRQSSRVSVCCLWGSQVHPLDLPNWVRYTRSNRSLLQLGVLNYVLLHLDGSMFVNPIQRRNYKTVADYQKARYAYMRNTFAFYQCTADDPPVCFHVNLPDDPDRYVRQPNGGGLHSPLLMIPMQRKLQEVGVPVLWSRYADCRNFLLTHLAP